MVICPILEWTNTPYDKPRICIGLYNFCNDSEKGTLGKESKINDSYVFFIKAKASIRA